MERPVQLSAARASEALLNNGQHGYELLGRPLISSAQMIALDRRLDRPRRSDPGQTHAFSDPIRPILMRERMLHLPGHVRCLTLFHTVDTLS